MSLATNISNLATRTATEIKAVRTLINGNAASLSALNTTAKGSLVAALNELKTGLDALSGSAAGINDAATGSASTWSSTKINAMITAAINALVAGAPTALDTLDELAAAIGDNASYAASITTALGNRLSFDAQTVTGAQQLQARTNILAASSVDVGPTDTNYVTVFEAGLL